MKQILKDTYRLFRNHPANYSETDSVHFQEDFDVIIKENHVREFKNASIVQLYLFNQLCLQKEYCLSRSISIKRAFKAYLKWLIFKKKNINQGVWVLDQWSSGYFHWFTEVLPRIISAQETNKDAPVLLPNSYQKNDFILKSIEAMNVKVVFYDIQKKLVVNNLSAPSHLQPAQFDPFYIQKVRDVFYINENSIIPTQKIYISRKKASRRKISNEKELQDLLFSFDFTTVYMEDLSFYDQVHLMKETKMIISNHGAGLTNMIFMKESASVIELKSDASDINNCFFNLAHALNHNYYYTINSGDSKEIQKANINVDLNKLAELLKSLQ